MSVYLINISEAVGRFHPVLVHLPIGILMMAVLLQWLAAYPKYQVSKQVVQLVYGAGIAGALLSSITGFLLSNSGDYEGNTVALHMWAGIGTTAMALLVFARIAQGAKDARWLSLFLIAGISATGHFGGSLTHGGDYLTAAWITEEQAAADIKPIANVQGAKVYADIVQPLLQNRCNSCHGPQKQKGGLRMDSPTALMKGGKNGDVIDAGKPAESELIKRLLLPREDDDHMPPKEKPQLTESQVALLHWWIEQGAPFDKKVAELQQPEKIKPLLASLQSPDVNKKQGSIIPEVTVPQADVKALQALRDKGVVVLPVNTTSGWLAANFITASFTDKDAPLLLPLKEQLLFVKMNDASIGDATLNVLSQCNNIAVLHLNNTAITDKGLAQLAALQNLRSLSLAGTNITASGLSALQHLPKLEQLYLYGSPATKNGRELQAFFPKVKIDTGGYRLPLLPGDTTDVAPPKR